MATKKKAAKPAVKKAAKPAVKKAAKPVLPKKTNPGKKYTGELQAWERNESIPCSADTTE